MESDSKLENDVIETFGFEKSGISDPIRDQERISDSKKEIPSELFYFPRLIPRGQDGDSYLEVDSNGEVMYEKIFDDLPRIITVQKKITLKEYLDSIFSWSQQIFLRSFLRKAFDKKHPECMTLQIISAHNSPWALLKHLLENVIETRPVIILTPEELYDGWSISDIWQKAPAPKILFLRTPEPFTGYIIKISPEFKKEHRYSMVDHLTEDMISWIVE